MGSFDLCYFPFLLSHLSREVVRIILLSVLSLLVSLLLFNDFNLLFWSPVIDIILVQLLNRLLVLELELISILYFFIKDIPESVFLLLLVSPLDLLVVIEYIVFYLTYILSLLILIFIVGIFLFTFLLLGIFLFFFLFFPSFFFFISEPVLFFKSLLDCFILCLDELFISLHV